MRLTPFLTLALCAASLGMAYADIAPSALETLVIQEGGRKKPYLVFAEESLRSLSGKTSVPLDGGRMDAMTIITGIWMDPSTDWKGKELILVSNRSLKNHLGLDPARKLFSWNELSSNEVLPKEMAAAAETRRRDPRAKLAGLQKEASDVGMRMGDILINVSHGSTDFPGVTTLHSVIGSTLDSNEFMDITVQQPSL